MVTFTSGYMLSERFLDCKSKENEFRSGKQTFTLFWTYSLCSGFIDASDSLKNISCDFPLYDLIKKVAETLQKTAIFAGISKIFIDTPTLFPSQYGCLKFRALDPYLKIIIKFSENHLNKIVEVAQLVVVATMGYFGYHTFVAGYALSQAYHFVDRVGLLPYEAGLNLDNVFSLLSSSYFFYNAPGFFNGLNVILITNSLINSIPVCQKVVQIVLNLPLIIFYTSLKWCGVRNICGHLDVMTSMQSQKDMTYAQIMNILNLRNQSDFELCPEALSKLAIDEELLAKDEDLDKMLHLFQSMDWGSKESLVAAKLRQDERFQDEKPTTSLQDYISENFDHFIKVCQGRPGYEAAGCKSELFLIKKNMIKINAYLGLLSSQNRRMEQEDILLKIAVECGKYCNLGALRATNEIIEEISFMQLDSSKHSSFEERIYSVLLATRKGMVLRYIDTFSSYMNANHLMQDIHAFSMVESHWYGFLPIRRDMDLEEIYLTNPLTVFTRSMLMEQYFNNLHTTLKTVGLNKIYSHVITLIGENPNLLDAEKELLFDEFNGCGSISLTHLDQRILNLLLCMLGVIKPT